MPIRLNNRMYFRTAESCALAGVTKNTFLRWVKNGNIPDVRFRDRRGWRLFTKSELERLKTKANEVHISSTRERWDKNGG